MYKTMARRLWRVSSTMPRSSQRHAMGHGRLVDQDIMKYKKREKTLADVCADARAVLLFIRAKRWKLRACQYRVGNSRTHTFLDMLCMDAENRAVIVELKTTLQEFAIYRQYYHERDAQTPRMRDNTPNTKYWRHQKQLCGNMQLWQQQEGKSNKIKGVVLVVCSGKVALIPLDKSLRPLFR